MTQEEAEKLKDTDIVYVTHEGFTAYTARGIERGSTIRHAYECEGVLRVLTERNKNGASYIDDYSYREIHHGIVDAIIRLDEIVKERNFSKTDEIPQDEIKLIAEQKYQFTSSAREQMMLERSVEYQYQRNHHSISSSS